MQTLAYTAVSFRLLARLNWDRLIMSGALFGSLMAGAYFGQLL